MAHLCGCYYMIQVPGIGWQKDTYSFQKTYLPLLDSSAHSTILSTTSKTVLKQIFTNPSTTEPIKQCTYTFPLYDGVSVVSFTCRIGKKVLTGVVKEKSKAKQIFNEAVARGETAGLLEQAPESADVFSTKLGNIPAGQSVVVEITYVGELKHTETEGIRFTIPTSIAPRYGNGPATTSSMQLNTDQGIKITVDVHMPEGSFIKGVQSPSHPIAVSMGTISTAANADPTMSKASATLSLGSSALEKDFVLIVSAKDTGIPKALLETHPTIPNHRALMATLVPKFALPPSRPEIVFVADRSGSMAGSPNTMLISALGVLLKSMPLGVKFNICSFGTSNSFLWSKSKPYSAETLAEATKHVNGFQANMGGTETYGAIKNTIDRRFADIPLEIILLTDGDIWSQEALFQYLNGKVAETKGNIRVFPLGIGNGVSHSLIEGLARAGNGFASAVQSGERLDTAVVRMLRGALSPHITDYTLEVKYEKKDDDFEVIEKVTEGMRVLLSEDAKPEPPKATISLFDTTVNPEKEDIKNTESPYAHLPNIPYPHLHQAPHNIPSLFAFSRTSVYLLLSPETIQRNPTSVVLRATSAHGPLALEIPIEVISEPGTTIHQLAAKKAVQDLEEGRGWIHDAKDQNGKLVKERYPSCFQELVEKEAVRLGEKFQIAGKWTSFVAVSSKVEIEKLEKARKSEDTLMEDDTDEVESADGKRKRRYSARNQVFDVEAEVDEDEEDDDDDDDDYAEAANSNPSAVPGSAATFGAAPQVGQSRFLRSSAPPQSDGGLQQALMSRKSAISTQESIENSLVRGEKLDGLVEKSGDLSSQSKKFYTKAKKSNTNPFAAAVGGVASMFGSSNSRSASASKEGPQLHGVFGGGRGGGAMFGAAPSSSSSTGGGGLFGNSPAMPQVSQYSMPSQNTAFGAPPAAPTGGLFGSSSTTGFRSESSSTGGLFGAAPSPTNPPPPPTSGGLFGSLGASRNESAAPRSRAAFGQVSAPPPPPAPRRLSKRADRSCERESSSSKSQPPKPLTPTEKLLALISLQDFTGSWASISSSPTSTTLKEISDILGFEIPSPPKNIDQKAWVTMVIIKCLEEKMPEEEGTWGLVVEKARGWLAGEGWSAQVGSGSKKELAVLEEEAGSVVEKGWVGI